MAVYYAIVQIERPAMAEKEAMTGKETMCH